MQRKLFSTFIFTLILITAAMLPLLAADPPTIIPFGDVQNETRAAYRALFDHTSQGERAHWAQTAFGQGTLNFPPGTVYAPDGIDGDGYDRLIISDTLNVRPALALNTQGTRIAVFRSTVSDDYGTAAWELADVREALEVYLLGALDYDILDEDALASADLSQYAIFIIPSVRWGNETDVLDALDKAALDNLQDFVETGGFLYAQSNGATIAQMAGVVPVGTVNLDDPLQIASGETPNAGQLSVLDHASPLSFSWLTDTLYLLTDPTLNAGGSLTAVAEYSNLAGDNQPAILTAEVGEGRVILVNGHPTAPSRRNQLPIFFNAILWATGHRAELYGDAVQIYNPDLDSHLLPAYEPGTPISYTLTFNNLWDEPMYNVTITETVIAGLNVLTGSIYPQPAAVIPQTNPSQTLVVWQFDVIPPGEVELGFIAETGTEMLQKGELTIGTGEASYLMGECTGGGGTGCLPDGTANLPDGFTQDTVRHQPFNVQSAMAARLMLDRDLELDRQFSIPPQGIDLDITVPIENKEDTPAANLVITDVVLLIAPIVDLEDQETILDRNNGETVWIANEVFFYNEDTGPYILPQGYTYTTQTVSLNDWDGEWAIFDVPYGTHNCTPPDQTRGLGNCVTIPITYSQYISITADNKLLLPVKTLIWDLGDFPGYHYEEPALRYGVNSRELFRRTVTFHGAPGIDLENEVVIPYDGGSVYTHLGDYPVFYRDKVSQGIVYVPQAPTSPLITWQDIWSRTYSVTLRAAFYDVFDWASCGGCSYEGDRHAALNVTFGMQADVDHDGARDEDVLLYPSRLDGVDLDIVLKDRALLSGIPDDEMLIDLGVFKGLGVNIKPLSDTWETSWDANVPGTLELSSTLAYDRLYFQHNIPADGTTVITVHAKIDSYPDRVTEGMIKLHDGARFTYRQQAAGPSRYEVYDTHIQGVIGAAPEVTIRKQGMPVAVSTYGDDVYYIFTLDDPADPRLLKRNGYGDPFLQSYGFTDAAATLYIGGKEGRNIMHSLVRPNELTRLRIEVNNNTGTEFSNVSLVPQPPAGISVTNIYTNPASVPPPIFFDLPFLNVDAIPDAGRGVYYFDLMVGDDYQGAWGEVITFPIAFSADNAPADFQIPPVQLGLDDGNGVYRSYGVAQTLILTDSIPEYVEVFSAALVTAEDVTELTGIITNADRAAIFAAYANTVPVAETAPGEMTFDLPADVLAQLYTPGDDVVYVAVKGSIAPPYAGINISNNGAYIQYTDEQGSVWNDVSDQLTVEAGGAVIRTDYTCITATTSAARNPNPGNDGGPGNCFIEPDAENTVALRVTLYNAGDRVAKNLTTTLVLPEGVSATATIPAAEAISQTVTWRGLGDLAPGSLTSVELTARVSLNPWGEIEGRGIVPQFIKVIHRNDSQFFDDKTQQTIQAKTGDIYNLPLRGGVIHVSRLYLPLILKIDDTVLYPDLVVADAQITPLDVTVVIKNQGDAAVNNIDEFWVDLYVAPNSPPTAVNQKWQDLSNEGIAWGITANALPVAPGDVMTLTLDSPYKVISETKYIGNLAVGTPIYVQVDAVDYDTDYGAVQENHEANGGAYNNIRAFTVANGNMDVKQLSPATQRSSGGNLPARR